MRVALAELLSKRPIEHPSKIKCATLIDGTLKLVIAGYKWWLIDPPREAHGEIILSFSGISAGSLGLPISHSEANEDLENFSLCKVSDLPWARPQDHLLYCSAPLPSPIDLYAALQDYPARCDAHLHVPDFLNGASSLTNFLALTRRQSYLLARCPDEVCALLTEELGRQGVDYSINTSRQSVPDQLRVSQDGHVFVCAEAWAEF